MCGQYTLMTGPTCLAAGMNGKDGSTGRKSMLAPEVPRRQSGVLQENGRKDSAAGEVSPAPKNGRLSQVQSLPRLHPVLQ